MVDVEVGIELKAIPDGFLGGNKGPKDEVVVSFVLMPTPLQKAGGHGISLAKWPQHIADLTKFLEVRVDGKRVDCNPIDLPKIDSSISDLWAAALGLNDHFGNVNHTAVDAFLPSAPRGTAAVAGEGYYSVEVYSAPAAEIGDTLTKASAGLRYMQVKRFLDADEQEKKLTKSINPISPAALQTTATTFLFGLGGERTIRDFSTEQNIPKTARLSGDMAVVIDALRRIAWTGRQTPPPRIAFLAKDKGKDGKSTTGRMPFDLVDEAHISGNLALGLAHEIGIARETHALAKRAVKEATNLKKGLLKESRDGKLGVSAQHQILSELFISFMRGVPPKKGELREQLGFKEVHKRYISDLDVIIPRINDAILNGQSESYDYYGTLKDEDSSSGPGFVGERDPIAALASYEFCMMPDRAEFNRTLASMQIEASAWAKDKIHAAATAPEQSPFIIRRLTGMLAYPDVARLFGLIIDVKISKSKLSEIRTPAQDFVIEGSFEPGPEISIPPPRPQQVVIPTVCKLDDVDFEAQSLFGRHKFSGIPADLHKGHLQLGSGGFAFLTVDVNAALESSTRAARNDLICRENGEFTTAMESGVTTHRTAGLAVIDKNIVLKAKLEQAMAELREPSEEDGLFRNALFLEDLVTGYRIDVGTREGNATNWRTLTNRGIEFPQIPSEKLNGASGHSASRERMNGYIRSVHREYDSGNPDAPDLPSQPKPIAAVYETLATWRNWSLAVPAEAQERSICEHDLRLEVAISLPASKSPETKLPRLRFGGDYTFGARYVLLNGSSLSYDEATENYKRVWPTTSELTLPGYRFRRHEPIAAPDIFHLEGMDASPKLKGKNEAKGEEYDYQEGLGTIVVGTDAKGEGTASTRLLLAGSQSFEMCELHGMLDGLPKLPESSFARLKTNPPIQPPLANANAKLYRGKSEKFAPYYVDPLAELMVIGYFKDGELASTPEYPGPIVVDLLAGGRKWPNVRAVSLDVKRVQSAGPHTGSSQRAALRDAGFNNDGAVLVVAEIEPAEIIELRAWCIPRKMAEMNQLAGLEQMLEVAPFVEKHLSGLSRSPAAAAFTGLVSAGGSNTRFSLFANQLRSDSAGILDTTSVVDGLFASIPVHGLCHNTTMELIHAVEKPLLTPSIANLWGVHEQQPANGGSDDEGPEQTIRKNWVQFIKQHKLTKDSRFEGPQEKLRRSGIEGSRRVLFGGAVDFHRRSTSTLELSGKWMDHTKDILPRRGADGKFRFVPVWKSFKLDPRKQLENIPYEVEGETSYGQFDLVFDGLSEPRLLFHEFDGTHAKRIDFTSVAISRFAKHFKDKPDHVPDVRSESEQRWTLTIPSTRRPDKVSIASVSTALHEDGGRVFDISDATVGRTLLPLARKIAIRLDLGSSWYSSGVGEMLGVVLWPPNLFDTPSAHAKALRHIGALPKFATCWGRDPVRMTGDLPRLLPASAIVNCKSYTRALVPVPPEEDAPKRVPQAEQDETEALAFVDCALALFEPIVDPETGHFHVDIEIDPGNSYNAFVHLGLVRYQPDSLLFDDYDLEVSLPVESQVTVMPERKLGARIGEHGVILNYSGAGYGAMNAGLLKSHKAPQPEREQLVASLDKLNTSTVDVAVLWRSRDREHSGVPLAVQPGHATEPPKLAEIVDMLPTVASPGFMFAWEFQIDFTSPGNSCPACRERNQIVVEAPEETGNFQIVIREYEHYLADEYDGRDGHDPAESLPAPEKYNSRLIKRVVSSFSIDLEPETMAPEPDEGDESSGK